MLTKNYRGGHILRNIFSLLIISPIKLHDRCKPNAGIHKNGPEYEILRGVGGGRINLTNLILKIGLVTKYDREMRGRSINTQYRTLLPYGRRQVPVINTN